MLNIFLAQDDFHLVGTPPTYTGVKGITDVKKLPPAAQKYVRFLEKEVGAPMSLISMGRSREETILMDKKFRWIP